MDHCGSVCCACEVEPWQGGSDGSHRHVFKCLKQCLLKEATTICTIAYIYTYINDDEDMYIYICIQVIDQTIDSIDQTMPPKTCVDGVRLGLATVDGRVKYPCISRGLRNPAMNREGTIVAFCEGACRWLAARIG